MVLDETGKSAWEWSQNSLVIIDRKCGQVRYTDEYYLMKHLSHFIQPGSHLLKSSENKNTLAFRTYEGNTVVVIYYPQDVAQNCSIKVDDKAIQVLLKAKSINTLVF